MTQVGVGGELDTSAQEGFERLTPTAVSTIADTIKLTAMSADLAFIHRAEKVWNRPRKGRLL
ncbi:hypothetical protein IWQ52_003793 [Labrenzia sp. EL_159]|nr:hypothetical protein [Labrenzia sp. EL_162]MBG6196263.1 hypothetical protein [Labrenzia sp. EL_159]